MRQQVGRVEAAWDDAREAAREAAAERLDRARRYNEKEVEASARSKATIEEALAARALAINTLHEHDLRVQKQRITNAEEVEFRIAEPGRGAASSDGRARARAPRTLGAPRRRRRRRRGAATSTISRTGRGGRRASHSSTPKRCMKSEPLPL